jgi:hypothetical protein
METTFGHGIVGGSWIVSKRKERQAADLALEILAGKDVSLCSREREQLTVFKSTRESKLPSDIVVRFN